MTVIRVQSIHVRRTKQRVRVARAVRVAHALRVVDIIGRVSLNTCLALLATLLALYIARVPH